MEDIIHKVQSTHCNIIDLKEFSLLQYILCIPGSKVEVKLVSL